MDYIELFAGIGGFRYGLENCGHSGRTSGERQLSAEGTSVSSNGGEGSSNQSEPSPILHGLELRGLGQEETNTQNDCPNAIIKPNIGQYAYRCVWSNDFDKYACSVYRYHYGEIHEGDIRAVDPAAIPDHDLIVGGFPCQSFSVAGARGGFSDTRGTLFAEICRIAGAKRPSYLFLENVKGLLSAPYTISPEEWTEDDFDPDTGEPTTKAEKKHKAIPGTKGWVFLTILHSLWELGYDCQWQLLNSKYHGVPQNRERVFIIGHLRGQPRPQVFPIGEDGELCDETPTRIARTVQVRQGQMDSNYIVGAVTGGGHSGGLHSQMTMVYQGGIRTASKIREYDGIVPTVATAYGTGGGNVPMVMGNVYGKGENGQVYNPEGICRTLKSGETNNPKSGGIGSSNAPKIMVAQALQTDGQLRTGTSWGTDKPQSSRSIRRLTPTECERLQSFPDGWTKYGLDKNGKKFEVSDTQRYKMCGNAVTTNVIRDIGEAFMQAVQNAV